MHPLTALIGLVEALAGFAAAFAAMPLGNLRLYCAALCASGAGFLTEGSAIRAIGLTLFGALWLVAWGLLWLRFSGVPLPGRVGRALAAVPAPRPFTHRKGGA